MQGHGCRLFISSSSPWGDAAALSVRSHLGFSEIPCRVQMKGHLKQRFAAKVNIITALSENRSAVSSQHTADYMGCNNKRTTRRNKLRPKLLKTLPKTKTEISIHTIQRPKVETDDFDSSNTHSKAESDNFDFSNKDFKYRTPSGGGMIADMDGTFSGENMLADVDGAFNGEAVTETVNETLSILNLQDGEDFIHHLTDRDRCITDYDIHDINVDEGALKNDWSMKDKLGDLLGSWKDWYVHHKRDVLTWGVGEAPIFVVSESGKGELKVSINEDEICNRFTAHPFGKDEAMETSLRLKIAEAKQHAWEIERGVVKPTRNSSIYHFLQTGEEKEGIIESASNRTTSTFLIGIVPTPRVLGSLQFGFSVLSGLVLVWAAWKFVSEYGRFFTENDKLKKKQLASESFRSYMVKNRVEFENKILNVQEMARQVSKVEQNSFEKCDLKTAVTNVNGGTREGDEPLNSKQLIKNNCDVSDPDTVDFSNGGDHDGSTMPKEANIHAENNHSFQEGCGSIDVKENRDRNQKSKQTMLPNVDISQHRQNSVERAACNAINETVSALHTEKGLDKDNNVSWKRLSVNGSQKIMTPVMTAVKRPKESIRSKYGKRSNKVTDASYLSNKSTFQVDPECSKQKDAIIKQKINSISRVKRKKARKLKPLATKGVRVFEEKIGDKEVEDNVSACCVGTAETKAELDMVNTTDGRSQIEPENGILQGNCALLQQEEELQWMRDEVLRKIVSKVQTNNIGGREPSDGLHSEEELLFFRGLQRKFEREGEIVKSWIKERVENLNYDKGVSWVDVSSMFSAIVSKDSAKESRSIVSSENVKDYTMFTTEKIRVDKEKLSFILKPTIVSVSSTLTSTDFPSMGMHENCKSRHVLDMPPEEELVEYASFYTEGKFKINEITGDPEMFVKKKTIRKNIQYKQEMKKLPWWLDLPYVLCIGLHRNDDDNVLNGLYSLEMGPVPDCSSKPRHTIAFEDHADARNFCYILQSHFHELGDIIALVIPLSTTDLYEEVKSTHLKVTVIRKGAVQLYAGQPLKEAEGRIIDIGTAIYNEKKREDHEIDSFAKDVFGNKRS